jgi:membrane protein YdbS with pleckstrin-like domain
MNNKTVEYKSSGILVPLLTTLFVGLKLTGHIDWSWFWVLSPLWISFAIALIVLMVFFVIVGILFALKQYTK